MGETKEYWRSGAWQQGRPYIIAEIGGNHEGDVSYAFKLLEKAAATGVDAVKFQIYTGERIVNKVVDPDRCKHFNKFALSNEEYLSLAARAKELGVDFMSSLWDVDTIATFDPHIPVHKVGSGDITNYPLLKRLALCNKPLVLSTAMSNIDEVRETVAFIQSCNPSLIEEGKLCLLQCVAMYGDPRDEYAHLLAMKHLQEEFPELVIGYSDHTKGVYACELALGMGAQVIEKHFTDDKTREFRDHHLSADPEEMKRLTQMRERVGVLHGHPIKKPDSRVETAQRVREFRKAVYPQSDLKEGQILQEKDLVTLRPHEGIGAEEFYTLVGKRLKKDKKALEPFSKEDFEES